MNVGRAERERSRLRMVFATEDEVKYISHLDTMRAWERAFRRAGLPLAYSSGHTPHARLAFAAALPVGFTSECEVMDAVLQEAVAPQEVARRLHCSLPRGISLRSVEVVPLLLPALQAQMRMVEYRVEIFAQESGERLRARLDGLLARTTIPRRRSRKGSLREYDLRPLVSDLWVEGSEGDSAVVGLRLLASSQGTARPEEVLEELGLSQVTRSVHRSRLIWED